MSANERNLPTLVYDGECRFCGIWVAHWRRLAGDSVTYSTFQDAEAHYPQLTHEQFERGVQLIQPDGTYSSNAEAVFELLKESPRRGWMRWMYRHVPGFAPISEGVYRTIGSHRDAAYWLTMLLWGKNIGPHDHTLTRWVFLRALGMIYLAAFLSLGSQITGLIGSAGILPVENFLSLFSEQFAVPGRYVVLPTLAWIDHSDAFLQLLCYGGAALSVLLILDIATVPVLVLLWAFYLSLANVGQIFLQFQWDILLLEVGFLAIFLDSFHVLPRLSRQRAPSLVVIWLFRLLLFRLMFMSGVVKLASGDPTWHNLTAMNYHYWTQPLPTSLAWFMAGLPDWFMRFSTLFTFAVELIVPFFFFLPRRLRFVGAALTIALQLLILLTGNYTFFNYLTIVLCILLFDDDALRRFFPAAMRTIRQRGPSLVKRVVALALAAVLLFVGGIRLLSLFDRTLSIERLPMPLQTVYDQVSDLRIVNGYGLFAVMTTTRPEIIVEGSSDGETWLAYEFPYKAGDLNRSPVYVAPHQPRLDWHMWFAALGSYRNNSWFVNFVHSLLEGSPDVLALMAENPFPDAPPTTIRARLYQYQFAADAEAGDEVGTWWARELVGDYLPPVSLDDFAPAE